MFLGVVLFSKCLSPAFRARSSGPVGISGRGWFSPLGWSSGCWSVLIGWIKAWEGDSKSAVGTPLTGEFGEMYKTWGEKILTCKQKSKFFIIGLKKEHENLLREGCCTRALLLYFTCSWVSLLLHWATVWRGAAAYTRQHLCARTRWARCPSRMWLSHRTHTHIVCSYPFRGCFLCSARYKNSQKTGWELGALKGIEPSA